MPHHPKSIPSRGISQHRKKLRTRCVFLKPEAADTALGIHFVVPGVPKNSLKTDTSADFKPALRLNPLPESADSQA